MKNSQITRRLLHLQVSKTENEKDLLKLRGYEKREKEEGKGKWINEKSLKCNISLKNIPYCLGSR